jgi:hypothetical protein
MWVEFMFEPKSATLYQLLEMMSQNMMLYDIFVASVLFKTELKNCYVFFISVIIGVIKMTSPTTTAVACNGNNKKCEC